MINEQEIKIQKSTDEVFQAFRRAGEKAGKVTSCNPGMGSMVIRVKAAFSRNVATIRVALAEITPGQTKVSFNAESCDGLIGVGSAGQAIDLLVDLASGILFPGTGKTEVEGSSISKAIALGMLLFFVVLFFTVLNMFDILF